MYVLYNFCLLVVFNTLIVDRVMDSTSNGINKLTWVILVLLAPLSWCHRDYGRQSQLPPGSSPLHPAGLWPELGPHEYAQ